MTGVRAVADDSFHQAQAFYNARNFTRGRDAALQGLADHPDDVRLLRLAGKCSAELGLDDAVEYLQRAINVQPDDVDTWLTLSDALVEAGRLDEAAGALREVVRLRPNDPVALLDLGLILRQLGRDEEAESSLQQAADAQPGNLMILRGLMDIYRRTGQTEKALRSAQQIIELQPEDVLATLDIADLSLELGELDQAVAAYSRLRHIDDNDEHEVYAYHGMIQAEMLRERWRRALDLAIDATRIDRYGLTTDLLAFNVAQVFGASDRPVPSRAEVDAALAAEQAEHRRLHTEELAL